MWAFAAGLSVVGKVGLSVAGGLSVMGGSAVVGADFSAVGEAGSSVVVGSFVEGADVAAGVVMLTVFFSYLSKMLIMKL